MIVGDALITSAEELFTVLSADGEFDITAWAMVPEPEVVPVAPTGRMPCAEEPALCVEGNPYANLSAEGPDPILYWSRYFAGEGCIGICSSSVSQEDADRCAQLQALRCGTPANTPAVTPGTPANPPPPGPWPQLFFSNDTYFLVCSDEILTVTNDLPFGIYRWGTSGLQMGAGMFTSVRSQAEADQLASAYLNTFVEQGLDSGLLVCGPANPGPIAAFEWEPILSPENNPCLPAQFRLIDKSMPGLTPYEFPGEQIPIVAWDWSYVCYSPVEQSPNTMTTLSGQNPGIVSIYRPQGTHRLAFAKLTVTDELGRSHTSYSYGIGATALVEPTHQITERLGVNITDATVVAEFEVGSDRPALIDDPTTGLVHFLSSQNLEPAAGHGRLTGWKVSWSTGGSTTYPTKMYADAKGGTQPPQLMLDATFLAWAHGESWPTMTGVLAKTFTPTEAGPLWYDSWGEAGPTLFFSASVVLHYWWNSNYSAAKNTTVLLTVAMGGGTLVTYSATYATHASKRPPWTLALVSWTTATMPPATVTIS